jgi:hypothetical protein
MKAKWCKTVFADQLTDFVLSRLPLYHLREAQASLALALGKDIVEHKFGVRSFRYTLRVCQLYDYRTHRWTNWAGEPTSSAAMELPAAGANVRA